MYPSYDHDRTYLLLAYDIRKIKGFFKTLFYAQEYLNAVNFTFT